MKKENDFFIHKSMFAIGCLETMGRIFEVCRIDNKVDYQKIKAGTGLTINRIQEIEKGIHVGEEVNFSQILKLYKFFNEKLVIIDKDFWLENPSV